MFIFKAEVGKHYFNIMVGSRIVDTVANVKEINYTVFELGRKRVYKFKKIRQFSLFQSVTDQSDGCGAKFSAVIVSPKFEGKPLLQRHRMVNSVLEEELKVIHAFSQQTLTPQQWEEKKS